MIKCLIQIQSTDAFQFPIYYHETFTRQDLRVSYPEYVRLKKIQNEAIKIDQVVRALLCVFNEEELTQNPDYQKLLRLYEPLKPILPLTYLETVGGKIDLASGHPGKLPPGSRCP